MRVDHDNEDDLGLLLGVDLLVKSPGVPGERPLVVAARAARDPGVVRGRARLASARAASVRRRYGHEREDDDVRAARRDLPCRRPDGRRRGERRHTALERRAPEDAWIVCELSSFQLEDVHELSLEVAVLLNLEPDHLDRHGTFERYRDAKLRIFERARHKVVPRGLGLEGVEFSADDPLPAEPRMPGRHNRENAAAATAAARAAGIDDERDRRRRCGRSQASPIGSSSCVNGTACAG